MNRKAGFALLDNTTRKVSCVQESSNFKAGLKNQFNQIIGVWVYKENGKTYWRPRPPVLVKGNWQ